MRNVCRPLNLPGTRKYPAKGWFEIDGRRFFFKSKWELLYANHLQLLKKLKVISEWEYEPHTFWFENIKRGVRSYLPDFKITNQDGTHFWAEVKGFMDAKSLTKIKRLRKYYPEEKLMVIGKEWFNSRSS